MITLLIVYDIPADNTRLKIANKLLEYGLNRIQYSVFIGKLKPHNFKALKQIVTKLINEEEDKVYIIKPSENTLVNTQMLGIFTDIKSILQPPETLIV